LEEARGDVRGSDADHFLVAVDVLTGPVGERGRRRDCVGKSHKRNARCPCEQEGEIGDPDAGERQRWKSLRQGADEADSVLGELEQIRRDDREDYRDEDCASAAVTVSLSATPFTNPFTSGIKPSASMENPKSFGSCPMRIVSAKPFM